MYELAAAVQPAVPLLQFPSLVSALPRFQTMTGGRVWSDCRVNGPGTVTSSAVRDLPPAPRPITTTVRHTPLPEAVPPVKLLLNEPGRNTSAKRTGAAIT